jgi:hypothetical protein
MRQTHVDGDKLFVDYAGDTVPVIVDPCAECGCLSEHPSPSFPRRRACGFKIPAARVPGIGCLISAHGRGCCVNQVVHRCSRALAPERIKPHSWAAAPIERSADRETRPAWPRGLSVVSARYCLRRPPYAHSPDLTARLPAAGPRPLQGLKGEHSERFVHPRWPLLDVGNNDPDGLSEI